LIFRNSFEIGDFTPKTHQIFTVYTTPEELRKKKQHSPPFWICVVGKFAEGKHMIIMTPSFLKRAGFKTFSVCTKAQSRRFQIPSV